MVLKSSCHWVCYPNTLADSGAPNCRLERGAKARLVWHPDIFGLILFQFYRDWSHHIPTGESSIIGPGCLEESQIIWSLYESSNGSRSPMFHNHIQRDSNLLQVLSSQI